MSKKNDKIRAFDEAVAARRLALRQQALPDSSLPSSITDIPGGVVRGVTNASIGAAETVGELGIAGVAGLARLFADDQASRDAIDTNEIIQGIRLREAAKTVRAPINDLTNALGLDIGEGTFIGSATEGLTGALAGGGMVARAVKPLGAALKSASAAKRVGASAATFGAGEALSFTSTRSIEEQSIVANLMKEAGWDNPLALDEADSMLVNRGRVALEGILLGMVADMGIEGASAWAKLRKAKETPAPRSPEDVAAMPGTEKYAENAAAAQAEVDARMRALVVREPGIDGEVMPDLRGPAAGGQRPASQTVDGTAREVTPPAALPPPASVAPPPAAVVDVPAPPAAAIPPAAPVVEQAPIAQAAPAPQASPLSDVLPKELAGAKPRYSFGDRQFDLSFESDLDRAAYITAGTKLSARDADYVRFVADRTGMTEPQVRAYGMRVRQAIKGQASTSQEKALRVPSLGPTVGVQPVKPAAAKKAAAPKAKKPAKTWQDEPVVPGGIQPSGMMSKGETMKMLDRGSNRYVLDRDGAPVGAPGMRETIYSPGDGTALRVVEADGRKAYFSGRVNERGVYDRRAETKIDSAHGKLKAEATIASMKDAVSKAEAVSAAAKAAPKAKKAKPASRIKESRPKAVTAASPKAALQQYARNILGDEWVVRLVKDNVLKGADANVDLARKIINIGTTRTNQMDLLNHEILHPLREAGAFTDQEWKALTNAARPHMDRWEINKRYAHLDAEGRLEEAVAELAREIMSGKRVPEGALARAWDAFKQVFEKLGNALRGAGFRSSRSIISNAYSGRSVADVRRLVASNAQRAGVIKESRPMPTEGGRGAAESWVRKNFDAEDANALMKAGDALGRAGFASGEAAGKAWRAVKSNPKGAAAAVADYMVKRVQEMENNALFTMTGNLISMSTRYRNAGKNEAANLIKGLVLDFDHTFRRMGEDAVGRTFAEEQRTIHNAFAAKFSPIQRRVKDMDEAAQGRVVDAAMDRSGAKYSALSFEERRLVDDITAWHKDYRDEMAPIIERNILDRLRWETKHGDRKQKKNAKKALAVYEKTGNVKGTMGDASTIVSGMKNTYGAPLRLGYMSRNLDIDRFYKNPAEYDALEKAVDDMFLTERLRDEMKKRLSPKEKDAVTNGTPYDEAAERQKIEASASWQKYVAKEKVKAAEDAKKFRRKIELEHVGITVTPGGRIMTSDVDGTSFLAKRIFPKDAERWLAPFYTKDIEMSMRSYNQAMSSEYGWQAKFGGSRLPELERRLMEAGMTNQDLGRIMSDIQVMTNRSSAMHGTRGARRVVAGLLAYQNIAFLARTFFTSMPEFLVAVAKAMASGGPSGGVGGFKGMMESIHDIKTAYQASFKWLQTNDAKALRGSLEDLGYVPEDMLYAMNAAQFGDIEMTKSLAKAQDQFFGLTLQTGQLRATRMFAAMTAARMMRRVADMEPSKMGAEGLADLGVPVARQAQFREYLRTMEYAGDGNPLPLRKSMDRDAEMRAFYDGAMDRIINGSALITDAASRPRWANHIYMRPFYGLLNYAFRYHRAVHLPMINRAVDGFGAWRRKDITTQDLMVSIAPLAFLYTIVPLAHAATSEVRGAFMGPNKDGENRMAALREDAPITGYAMLIAMRSGIVPPQLDYAVNAVTGVRYQRDLATTFAGPALGNLMGSAGKVAQGAYNGKWDQVADGFWDGIGMPALNGMLAVAPGGTVLNTASAVGIQAASHPQTNEAWLSLFK